MQNITLNGSGRRIALVVGVNTAPRSSKPPLKRSIADAQAIAEVLEQPFCGFDLAGGSPLLERQATTATVRAPLQQLIRESSKEDFILFYFSGHGIPMTVEAERRDVYLGTTDFNEDDALNDESYFISFKLLREMLYEKCPAGKVLLILDCCFAGDWGRLGPDLYLREIKNRFNYYFATSGDSTRVVAHGLRQVLAATGHRGLASDGSEYGITLTALLLPALNGKVEEAKNASGEVTTLTLSAYLENELRGLPTERRSSLSGDTAGYIFPLAFHKRLVPKPETVLPKACNPLFRERIGELEQLELYLFHSRQPARIGFIGMPGIGKSELATQIAHRYSAHYPDGIFWLEASGTSLEEWWEQFANLATEARYLPPGYNSQINAKEEVARYFCKYLVSYPNTLLILDDVKNPTNILEYLQKIAADEIRGTIIYTSQISIVPDGFDKHDVVALSFDDAQYLLIGETEREKELENSESQNESSAREIIAACEAHPLALMNFRGRCKRDPSLTLAKLATFVKSQGSLKSLARLGKLSTSFQASWGGLNNEDAKLLFKLAAYYPEKSAIPLWLLGLATGFSEQEDVDPLTEARLVLQELNLVNYAHDDHCLQLHSLWQEFGKIVVQEEMEGGSLLLQSAAERLVLAFEDLNKLEQYARQGYKESILRVQAAIGYISRLHEARTERLSFMKHLLERERHFLDDSDLWPDRIPALFCQQLYNRSIEVGHALKEPQFSTPWLHLLKPTGVEEQTPLKSFQILRRPTPKQAVYREQIVGMAISSKGDRLLATSEDSIAWLWNASDETTIRHFSYLDSAFRCVTFNTESTMIALGTSKGEIILWNIADETAFQFLSSTSEKTEVLLDEESLSLDGDSTIVNSEDENEENFENIPAEKLDDADFAEEEKGKVTVILFSPDSTKVLAGFEDGTAELWRAVKEEDAPLQVFKGHLDSITCTAFSEDNVRICTGSKDGTVRLWTSLNADSLCTFHCFTNQYPMEVVGLAFVPGDSFVLTSASFGEVIENTAHVHVSTRIWNIATGNWIDFPDGHSDPVQIFAFSPDGHLLLTCDIQNSVQLWEVKSPTDYQLLGAYSTTYPIGAIRWMENSRRFLLIDTGGETFLPHFHHLQVEGIRIKDFTVTT